MSDVLFRCSSLGHLMTDPRTRADGDLSIGARTYLREMAKQEIFSVEFEVSGKEIEKGLRVEDMSEVTFGRMMVEDVQPYVRTMGTRAWISRWGKYIPELIANDWMHARSAWKEAEDGNDSNAVSEVG